MRRVFSLLLRLPRLFFIGLVKAYQLLLSPHVGGTCRYHPTCSAYATQAFKQYGAMKGLVLTVHRLLRCHPWGGHGYDPPRWFGEDPPTETAPAHESPEPQTADSLSPSPREPVADDR